LSAVNAAPPHRAYSVGMPAIDGARLRDLLLPREHGGWSLAFEPVALGLLAAPSLAGGILAVAAAALFLVRRPAQFASGRFGPHRRGGATVVLGTLAVVALAALVASARLGGWPALQPLLLALPPGILFLVFDARGESRMAAAELAGAATFAVFPAACARLAGAGWPIALSLTALMLLRALPAVLVLRTFLRRRKNASVSTLPALLASVGAVGAAFALARAGLAGGPILGLSLLLLGRAIWLLGPAAPAWRASQLGALESALGLGFVITVGLA
jgi:hypothetical protein